MKSTTENRKVRNAFSLVKRDITGLWEAIYDLRADNIRMRSRLRRIEETIGSNIDIPAPTTAENQGYVLNKQNSKLHSRSCVFARNIKPENRVLFSTEDAVHGLSADKCVCMK